MNIFCHFWFIFFGQFSLCTRSQLWMRDVTCQMKLTFHVWGLWVVFRPFFDSKTVVIKLFCIKTKQKCIFILLIRNEVYQAQIGWMQIIQCSLNTAHPQCFKSHTHNSHFWNLVKNHRDVRLSHQCFHMEKPDLKDMYPISPTL